MTVFKFDWILLHLIVPCALCIKKKYKRKNWKKKKKNLPIYLSYSTAYLLILSLPNDTFSDVKLNVPIITGFICSSYFTKAMETRVLFILQKVGKSTIFVQKRQRGWLNSRGRLLREGNLCVYKSKNITIKYIRV